jgi:hypothetical protein
MAFKIYRNYDGKNSVFGDMALASSSADQGTLSVYGALRTSDNAMTVVVINKTYGDLTSTLSLTGLPSTVTTAQAYLYSNANLAAIVAQPAVTVTPPASGGTNSCHQQLHLPGAVDHPVCCAVVSTVVFKKDGELAQPDPATVEALGLKK